ncbi:MAG: hypothetical protein ACQKBY_11935 [Verrucomicrobiales bacterium]
MNLKTFIIGLLVSFGLPWFLVLAIPYSVMNNLKSPAYDEEADGSEGVYEVKRAGSVAQGSTIYGQEGCYYCHSQLIRPTYAGNDMWRGDWAGLRKNADHGDTRRETNEFDFAGEKVAHVGITRVGPDLSNFGRRLETYLKADPEFTAEEWVFVHLYNPRGKRGLFINSVCPSKPGLFKEVDARGAQGDALPVAAPEGRAIVPTERAKALASYLISLKKDNLDNPVPAAMNYGAGDSSKEEK